MATEPIDAEIAGTCVGADGSAIGMPQLCFDWWGNQIFWLVLALLATYFILSRIALPRIAAILAERAGAITNDLAAAEDLKAKAAEAEAAYDKALIEARAEANRIVDEAKAEIKGELDVAISKADAEIAAKSAESEKAIAEIRASALENIKIVASDTAAEIVTAMGGSADAPAIETAIATRMKG